MMGESKASSSARELFGKSQGVNLLAAARIFLFGARDVWFVVGVPVFLYANGWTFTMVGGFMALWTIFYGLTQAAAPAVVRRSADGLTAEVPAAQLWSALLALVPMLIIAALMANTPFRPDIILVVGLAVFGAAFAINSSVHSYLILAYAGSEKAAEDVGFYYAANAAGRFTGTMQSQLETISERLAANPWILRHPFRIGPGRLARDERGWHVSDSTGTRVPLQIRDEAAWLWLAGSRGLPVDVFGEWNGVNLRPLTVFFDHMWVNLADL
jgi:hypothetical protein